MTGREWRQGYIYSSPSLGGPTSSLSSPRLPLPTAGQHAFLWRRKLLLLRVGQMYFFGSSM